MFELQTLIVTYTCCWSLYCTRRRPVDSDLCVPSAVLDLLRAGNGGVEELLDAMSGSGCGLCSWCHGCNLEAGSWREKASTNWRVKLQNDCVCFSIPNHYYLEPFHFSLSNKICNCTTEPVSLVLLHVQPRPWHCGLSTT